MEFEETFVEPGEELYIMGTAQLSPYQDSNEQPEGHKNIMVGYAQGQRMYYISDKSEKELLHNSGSRTRFMILSGIFLAGLGLLMIISQFK